MKEIRLVSRDSLLALAQTIEAAQRFEKLGYTPRIITMKTLGDIKLSAPLYAVANESTAKEGRAFFTKELDEALLQGRADVAVHSFKDLPTEPVPGISSPVFFSEHPAHDIIISTGPVPENLIIGTSSLRRIHQLRHVFPSAKIVNLRGNVVSRLSKLMAASNDINAIAIAAAGFQRLVNFCEVPVATYQNLLQPEALGNLQTDLDRLRTFLASPHTVLSLPSASFPTAPGQGVLAIQHRADFSELREAFLEHTRIAERVMIERDVMAELGVGCHAPLGVSAKRTGRTAYFSVSACLSRSVNLSGPSFEEPVFLKRIVTKNIKNLAHELMHPPKIVYWWGRENMLPTYASIRLVPVPAFTQSLLNDAKAKHSPHKYAAIFISSPGVFGWLRANPEYLQRPMFCAGSETARALKDEFPDFDAVYIEGARGFAAALPEMVKSADGELLWLGSAMGVERATRIGANRPVEFCAVYENISILPRSDFARGLQADAVHALTSAAAATAFVEFHKSLTVQLQVSCFGESAAEVCERSGVEISHLSSAMNFTEYLDEITGSIKQIYGAKTNATQ